MSEWTWRDDCSLQFRQLDRGKANAAFIFRACNAHAGLVEAVEELLSLEALHVDDLSDADSETCISARAALQAATE